MIYLDNAATTFPKPSCMWGAMEYCGKTFLGNPGRSGHSFSIKTGMCVYEARKEIAGLIGSSDPSGIIFTENATGALNLGIKGLLTPGDHVITTAMEHNSVLRPLKYLEKNGVELTILKCKQDGSLDLNNLNKAFRETTKLVICTHASNVTGTLMPVASIGKLVKENNALFLIDASQTAGCFPIDVEEFQADLLAAPGHKGLLGPQGTGFLYVRNGIQLKGIKQGGTGTASKSLKQPTELPDGYEAGTVNALGICGLLSSIKWIKKVGVNQIRAHEKALLKRMDQGLRSIDGVEVYGPEDISLRAGIASFNIGDLDCEDVADRLNEEYSIGVRAGYHCAGLAHKTVGTWERGCIRASLGPFNTPREVEYFLRAVRRIAAVSSV